MGKTWDVLCKRVQCLVMGDLKQIKDFKLTILDHCIFAFGIQRSFVKPWLMHPSSFKPLKTD
jgi:hypothetical protein